MGHGLVSSALGLAVVSGAAQPPPGPAGAGPAITWEAPTECPDADAFRAKVAAYMGRVADAPPGGSAVVSVAQGSDGFRASIRVEQSGGVGERELQAPGCEALMLASAVVVAVALDPEAVAQAMEEQDEPPTPPESPPAPPPVVIEVRPEPAPPPAMLPKVALRTSGGITYGPLPGVAAVAAVDVTVDLGWLRLMGSLRYAPPKAATYEDDVGGRLQLAAGAARLCAAPQTTPARVAGCAGIEAGALIARGDQVRSAETAASAWVAAEAGPELSVRVHSRLALWLGVDMVVPVLRPAFNVGDRAPVFRVPPVGGRGLLGLEIGLP